MTVLEIITSALRQIGVATRARVLSADEMDDGLTMFQMMMDSWVSDRLLIPVRTLETIALPGATQSITLGASGADITTVRPEKVLSLLVRVGTVDYLCESLTEDEYQQIIIKGQASSWPTSFFYKPTYLNGTLYVWPTGTGSVSLVMESQKPIGSAAYALTDTLVLPTEYNLAVVLHLARRLAGQYGATVSPDDVAESEKLLRRIKDINSPSVRAVAAPELQAHFGSRPTFNIYRGN